MPPEPSLPTLHARTANAALGQGRPRWGATPPAKERKVAPYGSWYMPVKTWSAAYRRQFRLDPWGAQMLEEQEKEVLKEQLRLQPVPTKRQLAQTAQIAAPVALLRDRLGL